MQGHVHSETGRLRVVILGSVSTFSIHRPINATQRYYYKNDPPNSDLLIEQQEAFVKILRDHDVEIRWVVARPDSPLQVFTRDVATIVDDTLIITSLKEPIRQSESAAVAQFAKNVTTPVVTVNIGILEGGDVMVDGDSLYIGVSERTDAAGLTWINQQFAETHHIFPLKLRPSFLHLDTVFNLLPKSIALVFPLGVYTSALEDLAKRYNVVRVTIDEQKSLATNVLSLSDEEVISDLQHSRINSILREHGISVIELDFSEIAKLGGSFRCATCPIVRD